jgi:hypothetical protein
MCDMVENGAFGFHCTAYNSRSVLISEACEIVAFLAEPEMRLGATL